MAKAKSLFFCKECGMESAKWSGQCSSCRSWDTIVEAPKDRINKKGSLITNKENRPVALTEVSLDEENRIPTGMEELNRVLGGGIVGGSLVLVGGDPGIGKSTLLLQMCKLLGESNCSVL